jgi:hypothetical protein
MTQNNTFDRTVFSLCLEIDDLKDELEDNSQYDELYKREVLITMFCLRGSCTDKKELKEMFERILKKCKK